MKKNKQEGLGHRPKTDLRQIPGKMEKISKKLLKKKKGIKKTHITKNR